MRSAIAQLGAPPRFSLPNPVALCFCSCPAQDVVKALTRMDRLGGGSRQWRAFAAELLPQAESGLAHFDFLLADAAEATELQAARRAGLPRGAQAAAGTGDAEATWGGAASGP